MLRRVGLTIPCSVSKVEMVIPIALIDKALFPSISTFETPPTYDTRRAIERHVPMEVITVTRLPAYQGFHEAHQWHCCSPLFVRILPGHPWWLGATHLLLAPNTARLGQHSPAATGGWSRGAGRSLRAVPLRR